MRLFALSFVVAVAGLALAWLWGGPSACGIAFLLAVMEVSLSFDNAVVNASVLRHMSKPWQQRFLTWGMVIAVFGMRLLFPLVVVALATELSIADVFHLALHQPQEYRRYVLLAHVDIVSFGGMFLMMVFLHFIFDETKTLHWLGPAERKLSTMGKLESIEVMLALVLLIVLQAVLPEADRLRALTSGIIGVALYVTIYSLTSLMKDKKNGTRLAAYSGIIGFIYLQILDASFSLDGVIGAFAISMDIVLIMIGLGIGAMFVRSLTVYLVRQGTLARYVYLEHGAHYAIGALAVIMLVSILHPVPEVVPGLVGVIFILAALLSSVRHNRLAKPRKRRN